MRAVIQRVRQASVEVNGKEIARIGPGLLILLGVTHQDTSSMSLRLAERLAHLRIFEDEAGKMNRSLLDIRGAALVVSQFTLYGDCRRGRRPGFSEAAPPDQAEDLYKLFCRALEDMIKIVKQGEFGARMLVRLENDGPVTFIVES
jgi:D-tyrosyl-tRNA(Tyr) deacylase